MNRISMPDESVLAVKTKDIQIMPPEHQQLVKEISMEYSPNKNERFMYRYGLAIVFLFNTGLRGGEIIGLGTRSIVTYILEYF